MAEDSLAANDFRRHHPRFQGENLDANLKIMGAVRTVAERLDVTPGQLALAWVLAQGDDVVPIPGTKRVRYLEENVGAASVELRADDLAEPSGPCPRPSATATPT